MSGPENLGADQPYEKWTLDAWKRPDPAETPVQPPTAANGHPPNVGATPYALAALNDEAAELAAMQPGSGRNSRLNLALYRMGRHVGAGTISTCMVRSALEQAAQAAKLPQHEIDTCLRDADNGALNAGQAHPRHPAERPGQQQPPTVTVLGATEDESPADKAAEFARAVELHAYNLRVNDAARTKVAAEKAGEPPPFDAGLLDTILTRPAEPPDRVDRLIPSDANTAIVAQRKTGKTTIELNLARSLITGETFVEQFAVRPITGRVAFLNYEVSAAQLARWADEVGIDRHRLYLVNLRGRRNPLEHDDDRAQLAEQLRAHQTESLIVDPFGRAFVGKSQNDAGEVGAWLANLDRWARADVGAVDVVLSVHAGWNGERSRGSTALEDWADSVVTLVRDPDDDQVRYLRAEGRDVSVTEDRLAYDPHTRTLSLTGDGSRKTAAHAEKIAGLVPAVVDVVTTTPGLTGGKLGPALKLAGASFQKGDELKAARLAEERGLLVVVVEGALQARKHYPAPTPPPCKRSSSGQNRAHHPGPPTLRGPWRAPRLPAGGSPAAAAHTACVSGGGLQLGVSQQLGEGPSVDAHGLDV